MMERKRKHKMPPEKRQDETDTRGIDTEMLDSEREK